MPGAAWLASSEPPAADSGPEPDKITTAIDYNINMSCYKYSPR